MNYKIIYDEIIKRSKQRGLNKKLLSFYTEKHHIVPRCLGGTDDKVNLVLLTAREHYICHKLLTKMHKDNFKLIFAFHRICFSRIKKLDAFYPKLTSKEYELLRIEHSKYVGLINKGRCLSDEYKFKISESVKLYFKENPEAKIKISQFAKIKTGEKNPFYGKTHTNEFKKIHSERMKGKKPVNRRPVIIDNINFDSLSDASKALNLNVTVVLWRIKSKNKKFESWRFYEPNQSQIQKADRKVEY